MYNLRYHIASLVSVFLALSLGLILGGLIVQRGTFGDGTAGLIEGLQAEFASLREQNQALETENEQLNAFTSDFVDVWTAGRLAGNTVVIVTNAGRQDGLQAATEAVESAGGTPAIVTLLVPRFGLDDQDKRSALDTLAADAEDLESSIAASLAAEWVGSESERPLTDSLVELGVMSVEGLPDNAGTGGIIAIAAPEGVSDTAGTALAKEFSRLELPSAGAQTSQGDTGVVAAAAAADVAAFDTLGTEIGRYTAVWLMSGGEPGVFGVSALAEALYPPPPALEQQNESP